MRDAIVQSCDVYFYQLALALDIDVMHNALRTFGFGAVTQLDIPGEKRGLVPSRAWKRQAFSRREDRVWFPGETVITGIGQGFMLVTPLQLANAAATMAARGERYQPRLITAVGDGVTGTRERREPNAKERIAATEGQWSAIHDAMHDVTADLRGSARAAFLDADYSVAGKTGTAQVFSVAQEEEYDEEEVEERLRDHALFVAFAPAEEPTIAVAVVVENGGGGSRTAAPVARKILDAYFASTDYAARR